MSLLDNIDSERLLPSEKAYSIVRIDTFEPPTSSSAAQKLYEVDDLAEANVTRRTGTLWLAYSEDGEGTILPRKDAQSE